METVQRSAKTKELAIADALAALGVAEDKAIIEVLDEGSKGGFLGFGAKPVVVKASIKLEAEEIIKNFIREVLAAMNLDVVCDVTRKENRIYVNMNGDNIGILIGKRGQTLDSLQYISNLLLNGRGMSDISVLLDTGNYRKRRKDTLDSLARNMSRKAKSKNIIVKLEPMSRFERHIIHTALQNVRHVQTHSEGSEPRRYVVITPRKA